jgi:PAS domain S-box-containing protein
MVALNAYFGTAVGAAPEGSEKTYKTFFEIMNEGGLTLDEAGCILQCNPCFAMMVREPIDRLRGRRFFDSLPEACGERVSESIRLGRAEVIESVLISKLGEEMPVLLSFTPILETGEHMTCVVVTDLREQHAAVKALKQSEEFSRATLNSMRAHIAVLDLHGKIIAVNEPWQRFAAENAAEDFESGNKTGVGVDYLRVCEDAAGENHPGAREACEGIKSVLAGNISSFRLEYPCHSPNEERWFTMNVTRLGPEIRGAVVAHGDITMRVQAEETTKKALEEKVILLRELYHRTKNNMAVIIAMLNMQSANFDNEELKAAFTAAKNRIRSMALVHQKLYETKDLSRIELGEYIRELLELLTESYRIDSGDLKISLELQKVFLLIDSAIPCGLILNELISNIFKYAFRGGAGGEITILLRRGDEDEINLVVRDNGKGVPAGFDFRRDGNLGLQTIFLLGESQLQGKVEFDSRDGVEFRLRFRENYYKQGV